MNKYQRLLLAFFLCAIITFSPLTVPRAHALWPDIPGFTYKQMLEDIRYKIRGIILGMLKQKAIQTINKQVDSMMSGGGGKNSGRFISDWEAYLYKTPDKNTKLYMNDYLSRITSGRGSLGNYRSEGFGGLLGLGGGGGGGGYSSRLVAMAKRQTTERKDPKMTYEGDPSRMLSGKNFRPFNEYISGINSDWTFAANAKQEYLTKKQEERGLASNKARSYLGGIGTGEGVNGKGKITTPGSVHIQTQANAKDLGNKVIASAQHQEEVVTALVSKILTAAMKQGVGMISSKIPFGSQLGGLINGLNPSTLYNSNSSLVNRSQTYNGSMLNTFDRSNQANRANQPGSTTTYRGSSIPPPARNF